ncbi:MAG: putative baseplate assembly protein [Leptolyngbyaceae bacterium]|nr:putative baseplate assembly protein [Leptolyngbyaceae bacterium]
MDFDFLPKLPKSDLDDRTFNDLVDECLLRIPRYCPEWTNYNAADPGVTLIEMFAWLTDQMLLRFNQVPRRNYVAFLEMLGIRLQAATPAQTDITFYLAAARAERYTIPAGVEVATERTETDEAVIFSTTHPLVIGVPVVRHFLTAERAEDRPQDLRDRFSSIWSESDGIWSGREQTIFSDRPQPGNCFYLVFDPNEPLDGNVIAVTLQGEPAESTGINPDSPPRRWEAWNGQQWQPILRVEADDGTRGFSFDTTGNNEGNGIQTADVRLHLPMAWPATYFGSYTGRWLRCVYDQTQNQSAYSRSPTLVGISARAIGGMAHAHQCAIIRDEIVGESDGNPGQRFQLQSGKILPREAEAEHLVLTPPNGLPQNWQEVSDFANSGPDDRHYTLDSITGEIQFGPLVREPAMLRDDTRLRARIQAPPGQTTERTASEATGLEPAAVKLMERQYGAVPPKGAIIRMSTYRSGGGNRGNVQTGTLRILKSAVPYVAQVTNHQAARDGADAESLEDAVIRVPRLLRTRDRAITAEDFEALALQSSHAVARVQCPRESSGNGRQGTVDLLVVPRVDTAPIDQAMGLSPERFTLSDELRQNVLEFLDERRMLGIQVRIQEPNYVGVSVKIEVGLDPDYANQQAQEEIERSLLIRLYRFLNPINGGTDGKGWRFGNPVYTSNIVSLLQTVGGINHLGAISLFELRRQGVDWIRTPMPTGIIDPGPQGLICSWNNIQLRSGHSISIVA